MNVLAGNFGHFQHKSLSLSLQTLISVPNSASGWPSYTENKTASLLQNLKNSSKSLFILHHQKIGEIYSVMQVKILELEMESGWVD